MAERIGLEAVFQDAQFQQGVRRYAGDLNILGTQTEKAAERMSGAWSNVWDQSFMG